MVMGLYVRNRRSVPDATTINSSPSLLAVITLCVALHLADEAVPVAPSSKWSFFLFIELVDRSMTSCPAAIVENTDGSTR